MNEYQRSVQPVAPEGMELIFLYRCPKCGCKNPFVAPTQPAMAHCEACGTAFPLVPVDEHTVHFVKIMLGGGRAAVDPDFA